jgi:hypothetical protein
MSGEPPSRRVEDSTERLRETSLVDRLGQKGVSTEVPQLGPSHLVGSTADDEDWQFANFDLVTASNRFDQLIAANIRHFEVGHDCVDADLAQQIHRGGTVGDGQDLKTKIRQHFLKNVTDDGGVIDN